MPGFRVKATLRGGSIWDRLWRWLKRLGEQLFDFLKKIVGQKLISVVLGGWLTGWLITWNATHGGVIPPEQITVIVGSIVAIVMGFLGFKTVSDQTAALANSVPKDTHEKALDGLANSSPAGKTGVIRVKPNSVEFDPGVPTPEPITPADGG